MLRDHEVAVSRATHHLKIYMDGRKRLQQKRRAALSVRSASGYPLRGYPDHLLLLNMSLLRRRSADLSGKRGNVSLLALTLTAEMHAARPKRATSFPRTRTLNK
jgi:hypothetical protein